LHSAKPYVLLHKSDNEHPDANHTSAHHTPWNKTDHGYQQHDMHIADPLHLPAHRNASAVLAGGSLAAGGGGGGGALMPDGGGEAKGMGEVKVWGGVLATPTPPNSSNHTTSAIRNSTADQVPSNGAEEVGARSGGVEVAGAGLSGGGGGVDESKIPGTPGKRVLLFTMVQPAPSYQLMGDLGCFETLRCAVVRLGDTILFI